MEIEHQFLFNFAASYSGGGFKRLFEYAKWFHANGGAWFVIHPSCTQLITQFPNNRFFIANQSRYERLHNDCGYLDAVSKEMGQPELYYSYGIPIYSRFGKINWFHLSNVLPLGSRGIPLSLFDRLKLGFLGRRIRRGFENADVISAESNYSLNLISPGRIGRLFLSVNGSDDEIAYTQNDHVDNKDDVATVVGTYSYKALKDSYRVFEMLRQKDNRLKLKIIGEARNIPRPLRSKPDLIAAGMLSRPSVIACLCTTKFYISTTRIENSYNAASEGIFIADESYISDIGPHRELLKDMHFDEVSVAGVSRPLLHVRRSDISAANLKTWESVIVEMISHFRDSLRSLESQ